MRRPVHASAARALSTPAHPGGSMTHRLILTALAGALLAGCVEPASVPYSRPISASFGTAGARQQRVNGNLGAPGSPPPAEISLGSGTGLPGAAVGAGAASDLTSGVTLRGDASLDFADSDIREVVAQILGTILKVNYTIDPAVKGTATFHSARPLSAAQLLSVLQSLLAQNGAALVRSGDLYRVLPAAAAANLPGVATTDAMPGSVIVPLRYVSAADLAKVLQPVIGPSAKIVADPGQNAILVAGDPEARNAVVGLVRSFDVDMLAGQSYALLPVPQGANPKDFATTLQDAFRGHTGGGLTGLADLVRVLPLEHAGAVLVVASEPRYVAAARRVFQLIERQQQATLRSWHVYYLQNSHADDTAYLLQRAFTPNDVTAQPSSSAPPNPLTAGSQAAGGRGFGGGGFGGGGFGGGGFGGGGFGGGGYGGGGFGGYGGGGFGSGMGGGTLGGGGNGLTLLGQGATQAASGGAPAPGAPSSNPLLGGLGGGQGGAQATETMRIIPDPQNNSVLVYATAKEENTIEAMIRKIDILPLQVRIDAIIAEVTLNDTLKYGTQFFFKQGDLNETLSAAATGVPLAGSFPGFVIGATAKNAQAAISALQQVTTVRVLSSPEVMVLDNQPAALQVGDLVPFLTQSGQSTLVPGAPVVNSINYRPTGVVLNVTPRVNSGGLVTLDVAQEVSAINVAAPNFTNSPTFSDRFVQSRVVVQDGQTVGLAGLITDNINRGNQGIPFLKNVPILGLLAGTQNNARNRTELLVLITPHVVHDQRDARALTQDLLSQLPNAAIVPRLSNTLPPTGSPDPNDRLRGRAGMPP
jgi:general secretion pathway protein D